MTRFDALVCDLDGVVYRIDQPIPGAPEALNALHDDGVVIVFCTNNSSATPEAVAAKMKRMGADVDPASILTSATVTAEVLAQRSLDCVYVIGGEGIHEALAAHGITEVPADGCEVVVVGIDPSFDYAKMNEAAAAVRRGAALVATNDDATIPTPEGARPGAGAILASIECASGQRAEVMGKPHTPMMDAAARRLAGRRRIAIVGDRPETDLAGGRARGWTTILVTSGVTPSERVGEVDPRPDLVLPSITSLTDL